jgi:hypothetical protein
MLSRDSDENSHEGTCTLRPIAIYATDIYLQRFLHSALKEEQRWCCWDQCRFARQLLVRSETNVSVAAAAAAADGGVDSVRVENGHRAAVVKMGCDNDGAWWVPVHW